MTWAGDGEVATTGNVQNLSGSGAFTGMDFDYPYQSEADGYIDFFTTTSGEICLESQDGKVRVGCNTGAAGYKTITSGVIFSVFQENVTSRQELMAAYMEFLTGGTGIAENNSLTSQLFLSNPAIASFSAELVLQETAECDLGLFDLTGRRLGTFVSGSLSSGIHNLNVSGAEFPSGTYLVSGFLGNEQIRSRTVLLK